MRPPGPFGRSVFLNLIIFTRSIVEFQTSDPLPPVAPHLSYSWGAKQAQPYLLQKQHTVFQNVPF
jgi:hypothetical protein